MATIIDGKAIAAKIRGEIAEEVKRLGTRGITPGLAVVLVGEDPASLVVSVHHHDFNPRHLAGRGDMQAQYARVPRRAITHKVHLGRGAVQDGRGRIEKLIR